MAFGKGKEMIYITGDTHGKFQRIEAFCKAYQTKREDVLIILGDAGINFGGGEKDRMRKEFLSGLPLTIFAIHGNHEQRPATIETYREKLWRGGVVYEEEAYPNLLFAKDGEIFSLAGRQVIAIGGAYSLSKKCRLMEEVGWWADEQPSPAIKAYVEHRLAKRDWKIDVVLSHTAPLKYEPTEVFVPRKEPVDKTTEQWLDSIEERLSYQKWYFGHYHTEKKLEKIEIMFENYAVFCGDIERG